MARRKSNSEKNSGSGPSDIPKRVTLKELADHVKLAPGTVSTIINRSPVADSIPHETKERVFAAARKLNYKPNYLARSLRRQRTFSIGVLVPEIIDGYAVEVMSGVDSHLLKERYFYMVAGHRSRPDLLEEYIELLKERLVEGLILINTTISKAPGLPTVSVSGYQRLPGVTSVVLDNDQAASVALSHLTELGHEHIAFFKGHPGSVDTEDRWRAIHKAAGSLGVQVRPELTLQLSGEPTAEVFSPTDHYREGFAFGRKLLERGSTFTALFAFNDVAAIGASRAFLDAGLRIPEDVSVVGFDDIQSASYHNPSLTTVRQPLREMGEIAARILLERLAGDTSQSELVRLEPQLIVRDSTGPSPNRRRKLTPRRPATVETS